MTAELLREAASLMRERAEAATPGPWEPYVLGSEGYLVREANGQPRSGSRIPRPVRVARCGYEDWDTDKANARHIAGMHPTVALAVADWLDAVAAVHWPKRHDRYSGSHYNAEPEHDHLSGDCDESCWTEAYICNGCGTAECKSEISGRALAVARAYLGRES